MTNNFEERLTARKGLAQKVVESMEQLTEDIRAFNDCVVALRKDLRATGRMFEGSNILQGDIFALTNIVQAFIGSAFGLAPRPPELLTVLEKDDEATRSALKRIAESAGKAPARTWASSEHPQVAARLRTKLQGVRNHE